MKAITTLTASILLITLAACSPSPSQDVINAGVKAFTDTNAQLGWTTQSTKVVSSKQYQASLADKLNGIDDKWCLIIEFVVGVPGGYKDGQVLVSVKQIRGNWQAYADYPWFPPPLRCPETLQ